MWYWKYSCGATRPRNFFYIFIRFDTIPACDKHVLIAKTALAVRRAGKHFLRRPYFLLGYETKWSQTQKYGRRPEETQYPRKASDWSMADHVTITAQLPCIYFPYISHIFPIYFSYISLYTLIDCLRRFPAYTGFLAISTYLFIYLL